jgi:protein O-GlcNAc transferase
MRGDFGLTTLQQAAEAFNRGDWAQAERLCRSILSAQADSIDALNLLGIIAARTRRPEEAADLLGRAVAADPGNPSAHNNYGNVLRQLKRSADALNSYQRALSIKPDYAEAYFNRGNTLQDLSRFEEALDSYERALSIKPDYAEAYFYRGNALQALGRCAAALDSYEQALKIKPESAEAWNNRGVTLRKLRRFEDSLDSYQRALTIRPDYADAYFNRGITLQELTRFGDALNSYERALQIAPDAEVYNNRGNVLQALKRFEDALDSYQRALQLKPDYSEAYVNRGNVLQDLKRFEDALNSYERALQLKPDDAEAYLNRGNALQELERFADALDSYQRALSIKPDHAEAYCNRALTLRGLKRFAESLDSYERALSIAPDCRWLYGTWLHAKMRLCDWNNFESQVISLVAAIKQSKKITPPFPVLALSDSLSVQRQAARIWVNERYPATGLLPPIGKRDRGEKIRIGYYSADYHSHATAYLMAGLFEKHDRERFEVVAFSYGPDIRDDMSRRLGAAFDRFMDVRTTSDRDVARMSRELGIDIAVDLKGFTQEVRTGIFAHRAAPVQVNYLGYPGTMGAQFIDYIVADRTLIPPESRRHYAESVVYLPDSYQVNDRRRQIANKEFTHAELGLPSTGFVFCCFNNNYKITPDTFGGWMRILKRVAGSVLWLLEDNKIAANNLRKEAQAREVDAARLIFAPRMALPEHLARHRAADLFVDTLPCNAHTTASDALWAGVPVLTRIGESFAARVAASLLNAIGLPELIATTQEQYESTAIELAANPARLAEIKERLLKNRLTTPLFDTDLCARHLEDAYTQMYERSQADLRPADIYVAQ